MGKDFLDPELFNLLYPVSQIAKYPGGFIIIRKSQLQEKWATGAKRGVIEYLSQRSLSKLALTATSVEPGLLKSMITLTYGPNFPVNGRIVKRDLSQVLKWLNRKYGRYSYLWFLEFQNRGAPHFHILNSLEAQEHRRNALAQFWLKRQRVGHWPYSVLRNKKVLYLDESIERVAAHSKTWEAIRLVDGATRYVVKYSLKAKQKLVPEFFQDVGRFWATSPDLRLGMPERIIDTTEDDLRCWLHDIGHQVAEWDILPRIVLRFDKF